MFDWFIDALILKRSSQELFWNWDDATLKQCLNATRARIWYGRVSTQISWREWNTKFLGTSITKLIPVSNADTSGEDYVTVNTAFENYLGSMVRAKTINDESYQLLVHFSRCFHLRTKEWVYWVAISPKNDEELASSKFQFSFPKNPVGTPVTDTSENITGSLKEYSVLTEEDKKFQNALLLVKEVIDGYVDLRTHSVVVSDESWQKVVQYKMAEDMKLVLNHKTSTVVSLDQQPTIFSCDKTSTAWVIINDETWERIDYKDFETYHIETNPDNPDETIYYLRGAYTHILRKILNFQPQQWQFNFLLWEKQQSWLAGSRRMGKTTLAAYIINREIMAMPAKAQFRNRPRKALFIAPTKDKYKEVIDYFMEYTSKIRELRNITYNSRLDRITYEDQVLWVWQQKVRTPLSVCDFSTSRWFEAWRGKAADWIGIEEAGFVDEWVFDNLMPIIEWEWAKLFCISTINADEPAQWFYRELTRAEESMRNSPLSNVFALRVTIDDIDDRVMSQAQKEATKERALLRWLTYYYAELFATVPSKSSVFDTSGFFLPITTTKNTGIIIIAYDPAKRHDFWSVTVNAVMEGKIVQIETTRFQGMDYHEQRDRFKKILDKYASSKIYTVMDSTGVWEAVREIFRGLINYHVWYSNRKKPAELDNFGTWNIGKRDLVEITQSLIETKQMAAIADQDVLWNEMVNFTEYKTKTGSYSYEAKTGYDDVVNCLLLTGFVYGKLLGNYRWDTNTSSSQRPGGQQIGPRKMGNSMGKKPRYSFR